MNSKSTLMVMTLALLVGCGGGETTTPEPATEAATAAVEAVEATPAADDDDSGKTADDDDSGKTADDDDSAKPAVAAPEEPAPAAEEPAVAEEEPSKPAAANLTSDPPYSIDAGGIRTGETTATISVLLRGEAAVVDAMKWTVNVGPAKASGPKTKKNKEDYTVEWSLTGITAKEFKGSLVGQAEGYSVKAPFTVNALGVE